MTRKPKVKPIVMDDDGSKDSPIPPKKFYPPANPFAESGITRID